MIYFAGGWSPEAVSTLVVGIAAALLAIAAILVQLGTWFRDGPRLRAVILPAVQTDPTTFVVGVHPSDLSLGGVPVIALSLFATGRQAVHVAHVFFRTAQPIRERRWWWPSRGEPATRQVGEGDYLGRGRPGRIEATDRLDLLFRSEDLRGLAAFASEAGLPDEVQAVVVLGSGKTIHSKPYSMKRPPLGAFEQIDTTQT